MRTFRVRYKQLGGHIHCRVFSATNPSGTFAKLGELTMDATDWDSFRDQVGSGWQFVPEDSDKETTTSVPNDHIPWRRVVSSEPIENGETILQLECGHSDVWPFGELPVFTHCPTCDPPMFHGQPWSHPLIDAWKAKIEAHKKAGPQS